MGIFNFLKRKKDDDFDDTDFDSDFKSDSSFDENQKYGRGMPGVPKGSFEQQRNQPQQIFGSQETNPPPPPQASTQSINFGQQLQPQQSQISQQNQQPQRNFETESLKDKIEVLSLKMDSLKTSIDRIADRLDKVERYFMRR